MVKLGSLVLAGVYEHQLTDLSQPTEQKIGLLWQPSKQLIDWKF
jgi:hypothetical protein